MDIIIPQISSLNADNIASGTEKKFIINDIYDGNLTINSNLIVHGLSTTLNTDVYTTERLEISNTKLTSTALEVNQINSATKILSAFTTGAGKNEIFTITTNGRVGINKTIPEYNLDITGDIRITGDLYKGTEKFKASNWTSNINGILSYSNVAIGKELVASSPHKLDIGGNINFSGDLYKNNTIFKASNWTSNINGILSYSNVAIGKELVASSPHKLDIGGNINFSGDLYKNNTIFKASNWTSNINGILSYSNVAIGKELVASSPHKLDIGGNINFSGDLYKNNTIFKASNWTKTGNEIYYSGGNVGIAMTPTSAGENLQVGGTALFSQSIKLSSINNTAYMWSGLNNTFLGRAATAGTYSILAGPGDLVLSSDSRIILKTGATDSSIALCVNSLNNIAIGKANPLEKLDVAGSINISSGSKYKINGVNLSYSDLEGSLPSSSKWTQLNNNIYYNDGNVGININNPIEKLDVNGNIRSSGSITSFASFSDERLKDREGNIENPIDIVDKLQGFYYRPNKTANNLGIQGNKRELGISAQDVQKILPELVNIAPADMAYDEEKNIISKTGSNYLTVNYEKMIPLLIESIKELNKNINDLKKENIELRYLIKSQ
jgi:hypothetical protein